MLQASQRTYNITVTIYRVKQIDNLDPDIIWHNDADFYTEVTIDGDKQKGPKINGRNDAVFNHTFSQKVDPLKLDYEIEIEVWESDIKYDDHCDINPAAGLKDLILTFNALSYRFTGDMNGQGGVLTESIGAGDDDRARIWFIIDTADGRPFSEEDIAANSLDAVQVVFGATALVSGKPTMVMTRVVNNFKQAIETEISVRVSGAASRTVGVKIDPKLDPGEVRIMSLFVNDPIIPDASVDQYLRIRVEIDPDDEIGGPGIDPDENNVVSREWKVRETRSLRILYQRVDWHFWAAPFYSPISNAELEETMDLNSAFIKAIYPIASLNSLVSFYNYSEWSADPFFVPFELIMSLHIAAGLFGYNRIIGVVEPGWFDELPGWEGVAGVSMVTDVPRAVLMEPDRPTLAAHELGHTFGLSVDPRLGWQSGCYTPLRWDEYLLDPPEGNPAAGWWLAQGGEPAAVINLLGEQDNSHCVMGTAPKDAFNNWGSDRHWIDNACYEHLLDVLSVEADPEVIYVSGKIFRNDTVHLEPWWRRPDGIPDLTLESNASAPYAFRFVDEYGEVIGEAGFQAGFFEGPPPEGELGVLQEETGAQGKGTLQNCFPQLDFIPFGFSLPFPTDTHRIQIVNKTTDIVIGEKVVSEHEPSINIVFPSAGLNLNAGETYKIDWEGSDVDGDPLTHAVAYSDNGGVSWFPLAPRLTETEFEWNTRGLREGSQYFIKVIATDGVNTHETVSEPFSLVRRDVAVTDITPPTISIVSPENKTYSANTVPLTLTVDEATSWIGYSLDGQANITITGNTTLTELSDGTHSLVAYASDVAGNTGSSGMVYFSIETQQPEPQPEPQQGEPLQLWIIVAVVILGGGVTASLVYFLKIRKPTEKVK